MGRVEIYLEEPLKLMPLAGIFNYLLGMKGFFSSWTLSIGVAGFSRSPWSPQIALEHPDRPGAPRSPWSPQIALEPPDHYGASRNHKIPFLDPQTFLSRHLQFCIAIHHLFARLNYQSPRWNYTPLYHYIDYTNRKTIQHNRTIKSPSSTTKNQANRFNIHVEFVSKLEST